MQGFLGFCLAIFLCSVNVSVSMAQDPGQEAADPPPYTAEVYIHDMQGNVSTHGRTWVQGDMSRSDLMIGDVPQSSLVKPREGQAYMASPDIGVRRLPIDERSTVPRGAYREGVNESRGTYVGKKQIEGETVFGQRFEANGADGYATEIWTTRDGIIMRQVTINPDGTRSAMELRNIERGRLPASVFDPKNLKAE